MQNKKIAYLILAHTCPEQLERLVKACNYYSDFFIHIDLKSDISPFLALDLPSSTIFIKERVKVYWGGISQVLAILNLIKAALDNHQEYSHLVLLSGLDYPIKPAKKIHELLTSNPHKQYMKFMKIEDSVDRKFFRRYIFVEALPFISNKFINRLIRKLMTYALYPIRIRPVKNIIHCVGHAEWAITPECASYIVKYIEDNPQFMNFYRYSFCPDEQFFHTIVANSKFLSETDGIQKVTEGEIYQMANLHIIHPSLAKIYAEDDFAEIKNSDKLFVRKVTPYQSLGLMERIDQELLAVNPEDNL